MSLAPSRSREQKHKEAAASWLFGTMILPTLEDGVLQQKTETLAQSPLSRLRIALLLLSIPFGSRRNILLLPTRGRLSTALQC